MTLDLLFPQDQGSSIVDGINHLHNLLLSIDLLMESLLSTLDSLLFCIFIIHPDILFFKMGCSIRIDAKSWRKWVWTSGCPMWYDIYVGRPVGRLLLLVGQVGLEPTMVKPADLQSAAIATRRLTHMAWTEGLEPPTNCFVGSYSILLSYVHMMVEPAGVEPVHSDQ